MPIDGRRSTLPAGRKTLASAPEMNEPSPSANRIRFAFSHTVTGKLRNVFSGSSLNHLLHSTGAVVVFVTLPSNGAMSKQRIGTELALQGGTFQLAWSDGWRPPGAQSAFIK